MNEIAALLVERCLRAGAARAEALIKSGVSRIVSLDASGGMNWTRTAEGGVAVRVFREDGAAGFASACGPRPSDEEAGHLVSAAIDAARAPGPIFDLPSGKAGDGRGLGIFDHRLHTATPADLEGLLEDAATEALRSDPRVRHLDTASLAASSSEIVIANSEGLDGSYRQTLVHLSLGVVAADAGASLVVQRSRTARMLASFSPGLFGDQTARLAALALEGRPPAPRRCPALLAPGAAAELLRSFARTLRPPGPPAGARVASRLLTILDDGRLPGGVASAPFDGEGTPTQRTVVVSRGVFERMLHDRESAARHGAVSTGNGIRVSFRDAPRRMPGNLFVAPGSDGPEELLARLGEGIWIHSLRPTPAVSGDETGFAALATGRWVSNGTPGGAVSGALVTGSLAELLGDVAGVANDLTFGHPGGSLGCPSLLLDNVRIEALWNAGG